MRLKEALKDRDGGIRRGFESLIITLILLSLVTFAVETLPNLPAGVRTGLHAFEIFTVVLFALEYAARVWIAEKNWPSSSASSASSISWLSCRFSSAGSTPAWTCEGSVPFVSYGSSASSNSLATAARSTASSVPW